MLLNLYVATKIYFRWIGPARAPSFYLYHHLASSYIVINVENKWRNLFVFIRQPFPSNTENATVDTKKIEEVEK